MTAASGLHDLLVLAAGMSHRFGARGISCTILWLSLDELEKKKRLLMAQAQNTKPVYKSFEEMFEHPLSYLSKPLKLWDSGGFAWKRLILKLTFSEPLHYDKETGYRTPKTTLPFKLLEDFCSQNLKMVPRR